MKFFSGNPESKEKVRTVDVCIKEIGWDGLDCTSDRQWCTW